MVGSEKEEKPFHAKLSGLFMAGSVVACCLFSYSVGSWSKTYLENELGLHHHANNPNNVERINLADQQQPSKTDLPTPLAKGGKIIPETIYTSKNFDTRRSAYSSQWLQKEDLLDEDQISDISPQNVRLNETIDHEEEEEEEEEEEHLPAGQHLLVDIEGIEASFLDSQKDLATAMIQMVDSSGLTLLSYHCHGLTPEGVSCAGVLLESHVAFHTWPTEGVITLDLFTCGSTSLLDSLDMIENLFAIPRQNELLAKEKPLKMMWAYKRRGFKDQSTMTGQRDTFAYPLGIHGVDVKKEIASTVTSAGKEARIYDVQDVYQGPLGDWGRLTASNSAPPNRLLYLDGVLKAAQLWEVPAYESFVHPSMLVHDDAKKILIVGGGIGASIREVLKYSTVEQVVVIGADEGLVGLAKQYLPTWNDCSDLVIGTTINSCFDDPRVELVYQSPTEWLESSTGSKFDVAIVDYFDLDEEDSAALMDDHATFFSGLKSLLNKDGVVSLHIPANARSVDSVSIKRKNDVVGGQSCRRGEISTELINAGFEVTKEYEESETGFIDSRSYVVGFVDSRSAEQKWTRNAAEVNAAIQKKVVSTKSGRSTLRFFDGATMASYSRSVALTNQSPEMKVGTIPALNDNAPAPTILEDNKNEVVAETKSDTANNKANLSLEVDGTTICTISDEGQQVPRGCQEAIQS